MTRPRAYMMRLLFLAGSLILVSVLYRLLPAGYPYTIGARVPTMYILREEGLPLAFVILAVLLAVQLLRIGISLAASATAPRAWVVDLDQRGPSRALWELFRRQPYGTGRLKILFVVWSLLIFGAVMVLRVTGRLDAADARIAREVGAVRDADSAASVVVFTLMSADNNPTRYLQDLTRIASDLRTAGARVIVAREPYLPQSKTVRGELRDALQRSGVVLYKEWPFRTMGQSYPPDVRSQTRSTEYVPPIEVDANVAPANPFDSSPVIQWYPCDYNYAWLTIDASLPAAAKFLGSPDTLRPVCEPDRVLYGPLVIPVGSDGRAITVSTFRFDQVTPNMGATRELDSDTMKYYTSNGKVLTSAFPPEDAAKFRGRIVFVQWFSGMDSMNFLQGVAYANVIESLIRGRVVTVSERLPIVLSGVVICLSALLCYRWKLRIVIPSVLILGSIVFAASIWLLLTQSVLINAAYPAAAAVLSAVIFPLVRLAHENP